MAREAHRSCSMSLSTTIAVLTLLSNLPAAVPQASRNRQKPAMEVARLYGNINKYAYYFTDLLIGSPTPQRTSVIIDTGSRLVGFPCKGCEHCGAHIDPAFDFRASQTAKWMYCGEGCVQGCVSGQCTYRETYSEGSSIYGHWFNDQVELGDSFQKNPPVTARMGCHNMENKLFYTQRANGIMGLAPSRDGINSTRPNVLHDLFKDKKHVSTQIFSICLASWGGRLTVGGYDSSYHAPGSVVEWTDLRASHYYFVFPEGLSLSGGDPDQPLQQVASRNDEFGVAIIDSGTTYTYFPKDLYRTLVNRINSYCDSHDGCKAMREGNCYRLRDTMGRPNAFPTLVIRMKGGVDVNWSPHQYLHERGELGVWCQTFMENSLYQTVFGISWMLHKDVIFDLGNSRVGVVKANCPEHHKETDIVQKSAVGIGPVRLTWVSPWQYFLAAAGFSLSAVSMLAYVVSFLCRQLRLIPLQFGDQEPNAEEGLVRQPEKEEQETMAHTFAGPGSE